MKPLVKEFKMKISEMCDQILLLLLSPILGIIFSLRIVNCGLLDEILDENLIKTKFSKMFSLVTFLLISPILGIVYFLIIGNWDYLDLYLNELENKKLEKILKDIQNIVDEKN